jgi:ketosteroid isomerase-like protein
VAASSPDQVIHEFAKFFNAGDLEGLLGGLYEPDAVLVPEPGAAIAAGHEAIREALQAFLAMGATMRIIADVAWVNGDIGLTHSSWRLDLPDAEPMEGTTAEVVRRQPDGSWKYVIDNPWGATVLAAS